VRNRPRLVAAILWLGMLAGHALHRFTRCATAGLGELQLGPPAVDFIPAEARS
jgi:hypothetical protein